MDYYSTKRVAAEPRDRLTQGNDEPTRGMSLTYQDGYTSWCPIDVFQRDYQPVNAMSFGHALHALKAGHRVCRKGWNGKGMWLVLVPADGWNINPEWWAGSESEVVLPWIGMFTADHKFVPWLCSQTDMLVDDWMLVDD